MNEEIAKTKENLERILRELNKLEEQNKISKEKGNQENIELIKKIEELNKVLDGFKFILEKKEEKLTGKIKYPQKSSSLQINEYNQISENSNKKSKMSSSLDITIGNTITVMRNNDEYNTENYKFSFFEYKKELKKFFKELLIMNPYIGQRIGEGIKENHINKALVYALVKDYDKLDRQQAHIVLSTLINLSGSKYQNEKLANINIDARDMSDRPFWKSFFTKKKYNELAELKYRIDGEVLKGECKSNYMEIIGKYKPTNLVKKIFKNKKNELNQDDQEKIGNKKIEETLEDKQKTFKKKLGYKQNKFQETLETIPKQERVGYIQELLNSQPDDLKLEWYIDDDASVSNLKKEAQKALSKMQIQSQIDEEVSDEDKVK